MIRSEFHYGKFERMMPLSSPVQTDQVKAEYSNGILRLSLPKAEPAQKKTIKVEVV
jgi:HSP20 family protein